MSTTPAVDLDQVLERALRPLLTQPEALRIASRTRENSVSFTVRVSPEDAPRLLGRGNDTVRALRLVMETAARRAGLRVQLDLQDA
jgi:predicted RNA-binding protein YlqC (UPF0109 family)